MIWTETQYLIYLRAWLNSHIIAMTIYNLETFDVALPLVSFDELVHAPSHFQHDTKAKFRRQKLESDCFLLFCDKFG